MFGDASEVDKKKGDDDQEGEEQHESQPLAGPLDRGVLSGSSKDRSLRQGDGTGDRLSGAGNIPPRL